MKNKMVGITKEGILGTTLELLDEMLESEIPGRSVSYFLVSALG